MIQRYLSIQTSVPQKLMRINRKLRRWAPYADFEDVLYTFRRYRQRFGSWPNVVQPQTIGEWVQRVKLFARDPRLPRLADKLALRDWIAERIGSGHLPQLYAVYDTAEQLRLCELPPAFVLKPTHGSGWVSIVTDGNTADEQQLVRTARRWLRMNYADHSREWPYRRIQPRLLVEELFSDGGPGPVPTDYKLHCFNGRVAAVQVHTERYTRHRRAVYSPAWEYLGWTVREWQPDVPAAKPVQLAEMIRLAERLSAEFTYLRVDLYASATRVVVGELTFFPSNGFDAISDETFERELGRYWSAAAARAGYSGRPGS
jgi:hypothetical protein